MGLLPHTHLDPGKLIGAQVLDDIFQPVVSPRRAAPPDTQFAHRKGHVVGEHQNMVGRNFIKVRRRTHRLSGEVHKSHRLHQQHPRAANLRLSGERPVFQPLDRYAGPFGQLVGHPEAHIVPRPLILVPYVAQPHNEPVHSGGLFSKQHVTPPQKKAGRCPVPPRLIASYWNSLETEISS